MSNSYEFQELAIEMLNLQEDADLADIDEAMFNKFDVDFEVFEKIARALLDNTPLVETVLTKTVCHAFVSKKNLNTILVRKEYK